MTIRENADEALRNMVDELGDLEAETQPIRAKIARADALRAALREVYKTADSGKTFSRDGDRWRVLVGVKGNQSLVDRIKLLALIGPKKFAGVATISIKSLLDVCGAGVAGAVVSTEATGPRPLTVVPIEAREE